MAARDSSAFSLGWSRTWLTKPRGRDPGAVNEQQEQWKRTNFPSRAPGSYGEEKANTCGTIAAWLRGPVA